MTDVAASPLPGLWRQMVTARAFDQAMCQHNPHWHEARGEEAVIVGAFTGLRASDVVAPHFRGACAVALLRGADPAVIAGGVFGTSRSLSQGQWRGDICPAPSDRFVGMFSGSLGTSVAYAAGAALHLKNSGTDDVVVCAFGDGTANAGIVSETLNLAAMLCLPIVFVCQNNQYATSLPATTALAGGGVRQRAQALGIAGVDVDGNDVSAVSQARESGVQRARRGEGPTLIHALTYRMGGHFMNDPEVYRSDEEKATWSARDPVLLTERQIVDGGATTRAECQAFTAGQTALFEDVVARAKDDPAELGRTEPGRRLPTSAFVEAAAGASS